MAPQIGDRLLIPIERELQGRVDWFIRLRWVAAASILIGSWFVTSFAVPGIPALPLYITGLAVFAYNSLFYYFRRRYKVPPPHLNQNILLQIGLDWLALVLLVHYSGGIWSPVALAFNFHLIIGAILLSQRTCYFLACLASAALFTVAALEETEVWPAPSLDYLESTVFGTLSGLYVWLALAAFLFITTYLATSITTRLREEEEALSRSERALSRAYLEMEALYKLGQAVNSTLDSKEVLGLIAEHGAKLLGMKACFVRLFDRSRKNLYIGGSWGLSQAYLDKGPVEVSKSLIDSETLKGGVVQVLNVSEDPRFQYREEARKEGLVSVLCVPVQAKSRVLGVIRVYSDKMHHFSEQEQTLLRNLANLGAVAIENARSYADLKAMSEQRVWFARMTHHQLRSPLAAVRSTLDALPYASTLSEKQAELVDRAKRRVEDAFDTIRDLLDLAAAQRLMEDKELETVLLRETLKQVFESTSERAKSKEIEFLVEIPDKGLVLQITPADLERIFSNLLENAVKYTPRGGTVTFRAWKEGDSVVGEVTDTGIGIDESDQKRIFEGFYRAPSAKATGEVGTGLGLSIVRELVVRLGGDLRLESSPGKGTSFQVKLPMVHVESPSKEE